ncbi:NIPSNAP family containing protein [Paraflavitalea soli]|uniref:NIPSNAP family containing protein n=1 Tax=Paraflavitalea soli TaxID=2315862 RepID=A0A3B7MLJ7_9BACT|nr:NIPSNAP family protein [Paraflavitalea soli]AXY75292.1 NIPSNAP family containing protein [Paraflavitalea soli]
MKRRRFIQSTLLTGASTALVPAAVLSADAGKKKQEYYELRVYSFKDDAQQQLTETYLAQAAIPALNRMGCKHVGVFTEMQPTGHTRLFVVISFPSLDDFTGMDVTLAKDITFQQAATDYLMAPADAPAYERIQSSLLKSFSGMPNLVAPAGKERIFELRRYESPTEYAGKKKIEMFNEGGEIDIFKKTGLTPVFFGETLIGEARPNLTYMITFDNMEKHDLNWKAFGSDPEWKRIASMEEYSDKKLISKITRTFLKPTSYSQI